MALSNDDHLAALSKDLIQALDNLSGLHPGFRPAHAKATLAQLVERLIRAQQVGGSRPAGGASPPASFQ